MSVVDVPNESAHEVAPKGIARSEVLLLPGLASGILFLVFGKSWLSNLANPWCALVLFGVLIAAILTSAFGVVRHADCLAIKLGEPYGTLILTLSVIGMEVLMVSAMMLSGTPDPAMARDTMFAVVMIVLNGLLGIALLAGAWRHREQQYNLQGAVSFLAMLVPLSATGMILPYYTSTGTPFLIKLRATALIVTTVGLYGVFLAIQTFRHPEHFDEPAKAKLSDEAAEASEHHHFAIRSLPFHVACLILYLLPVVVLSKKLAVVLEYGADRLGAPQALSGTIVAILILCPEGVSGIRAALGNRMQRSVNLIFGSAVSTIALTVPAVVAISLFTGVQLELGLTPVNQVLLSVTLLVSILTCATGRTNVLNGFVHLVLFVTYMLLIFEK
ncbi:MAG: calcium:proton antiporter [Verrucomicrobia bacterium]|nr:MAG: calcium:proton antiporter [Verrucomicrobiota bacterium]